MSNYVEEVYSIPRVVSIISSLFQRVADQNDDAMHKTTTDSAFVALAKPSISIQSYLERIFRYANCSSSCYAVAYIYLDRFLNKHPFVAINSFNAHRFIITSVLVAVKFMDDICYNNAYFAKVGGISLIEMNYLEVDFLFGVGFQLNVTPATFNSYCSILQTQMHIKYPRLHCSLSDTSEESTNCKQSKQMNVREVFGT